MIINVGSKNPQKIAAVQEIITEYDTLRYSSIRSFNAESQVSPQPKTLEEMIQGAHNRARNAFLDCHASIGIESGIMTAPGTNTGYLGPCCATLYDGKQYFTGLGPAFEYPSEIINIVINQGLELDEAIKKAGYTDDPRIGYKNGVIGWLTDQKITRKDLIKNALRMALTSYLKKELYK